MFHFNFNCAGKAVWSPTWREGLPLWLDAAPLRSLIQNHIDREFVSMFQPSSLPVEPPRMACANATERHSEQAVMDANHRTRGVSLRVFRDSPQDVLDVVTIHGHSVRLLSGDSQRAYSDNGCYAEVPVAVVLPYAEYLSFLELKQKANALAFSAARL